MRLIYKTFSSLQFSNRSHSYLDCRLFFMPPSAMPLPPQDHKSGTVCRPISDYVGCHTACSSGGYWRHFYSDSEATAQCELFLTATNRNILTYLLRPNWQAKGGGIVYFYLPLRPSVRSFVRPSVRYQTCDHLKTNEIDYDANWHTWSAG